MSRSWAVSNRDRCQITSDLHNRKGAADDGLIQRFQLVVWPDTVSWRNVDRQTDAEVRNQAFAVFDRLDRIDPAELGARIDEQGLPYLRFDDDVQVLFTAWRTELEGRLREEGLAPIMEAHLAKYQSLVPFLALLIHVVDATSPVSYMALVRACAWAEYLESHARRIYGLDELQRTCARTLGEHIQAGDLGSEFAARDVQQKSWSGLSESAVIKDALDLLVSLDWLRVEVIPTEGRPRTRYVVSPRVHTSVA